MFGNAGTHGVLVVVLMPDLVLANASCRKLRDLTGINVEHAVVLPARVAKEC